MLDCLLGLDKRVVCLDPAVRYGLLGIKVPAYLEFLLGRAVGRRYLVPNETLVVFDVCASGLGCVLSQILSGCLVVAGAVGGCFDAACG